MSDPRMIPADDAQITLDVINHAGGYGFSFHDTYVRDLAYTVDQQAAQIERLQAAIRVLSYPCAGDLIGLIGKGVLSKEDMEDNDE